MKDSFKHEQKSFAFFKKKYLFIYGHKACGILVPRPGIEPMS